MNKVKKIALSSAFALALIVGGSGVALAEEAMGGDWYWGTNWVTGNATTSYYHANQTHWTSVGTTSGKYARDESSSGKTASTWVWRTPFSGVTFKAGWGNNSDTREQ